ncbi:12120_t:CDS:2, partial [Gigaspora margarita]
IKLSPNEEGFWKLYLHLDLVAWYDALNLLPNETSRSVLEKAQKYVDSVRDAYKPLHSEKSIYKPVLSKPYCIRHGECIKCEYLIWTLNTDAKNNRNSITDGISLPQQNRACRVCNWYAEQEWIVQFDKRSKEESKGYKLRVSEMAKDKNEVDCHKRFQTQCS